MATKDALLRIDDLTGGQNAAQPPSRLAATQCVAAVNVEWYRSPVARKRRGSRLVERTSGASPLPSNKVFATIAAVQRPGNIVSANPVGVIIETTDFAYYQWGYDPSYPFAGVGIGPDTPTTNACLAYFNGKWFAAFKSNVDRLHYLGTYPGNTGYRAGLAAPATPVISKSAAAVNDTRKYRAVVYYNATGGPRSEPSAETSAQSLAAQQASAAAPGAAPAGELYNQWELQVASVIDNYATWWVVGNAGPTTAIVDNNASVFGLTPAPQLGLFTPPISVKYLGVDGNRLLLAGAYEDTADNAVQWRVWFTPVLGDRDQGDDQRVPSTTTLDNWVDVDAGDQGGDITGFGPATLGEVLVFKRAQIWRLQRTGNLDAPYIPRAMSKTVGTFGYRTIQAGEDAAGQPCVYFAGQRGPYRVGVNGVEYLGAAIEDVWAGVNQFGNPHTSQHAVYYPDRGQYWLWVSIGSARQPSVCLIYTVATGGWASYTGILATAVCSALLPRYVQEPSKGVTNGSATTAPWVPYVCPDVNGYVVECDAINPQTGVALDTDFEAYSGSGSVWTDGQAYRSYVTTRPIPKALDRLVTVKGASVQADVATGVTLGLSLIKNFGGLQRDFTVSLTADGAETIVDKKVPISEIANATNVQVQIGDAAAVASQWNLHAVQLRVAEEAEQ